MQIEEARKQQSQSAEVLSQGLVQLDLNQEVTFQKYSRVVLPLDGYVFWQPTTCLKVTGSLHHTQQIIQAEDETLGFSTVTFSTQEHVPEFTDVPIDSIYIASLGALRYAFSSHGGYFNAASLWHYQGHSIYPAMASQLLDTPGVLDPTRAVVSNSLPIWLSLNGYVSPYIGGYSSGITLYPSKAVPANLPPPYGSVHIDPDRTEALQSIPLVCMVQVPSLDSSGNQIIGSNGQPVTVPTRVQYQLMADNVRIVLYGLQNEEALAFYGSVLEFMRTQTGMGLMNVPALTDGKREQVELQALAMQKVIEFKVSYQQYYAKAVALQLIKSASLTLYLNS